MTCRSHQSKTGQCQISEQRVTASQEAQIRWVKLTSSEQGAFRAHLGWRFMARGRLSCMQLQPSHAVQMAVEDRFLNSQPTNLSVAPVPASAFSLPVRVSTSPGSAVGLATPS